MHERAAFEAVPFEGVDLVGLSLWFHHKTDGFRRPLRRMSYMRGQQEYFALPNRHIVKITVVADLQHHVALQLVKEFLHRVVMIIGAFVWTADYHHGHFAVLEHLLVADRRLKQVCVLVDPLLEVERLKPSALHDGVLGFSPQMNFPRSASLAF